MPISDYLANNILDHVLRGEVTNTGFDPPLSKYVSLHYGNPTTGNGHEFDGGSYARQPCSFSTPVAGVTSNAIVLNFNNLPTQSTGVAYVGIWDSLTGGNLLFFDSRSPLPLNSGDSYAWNAQALTVKLYEE